MQKVQATLPEHRKVTKKEYITQITFLKSSQKLPNLSCKYKYECKIKHKLKKKKKKLHYHIEIFTPVY